MNKETVFVVREGEDYEAGTNLLAAFSTLGQAQEFCAERWPDHSAWEFSGQGASPTAEAAYWTASKTQAKGYDPHFIEINEVVINPQEGDPL